MKRAGFDEATIQGYIVEQRLPEWVHNNPDHTPYEDDEDEDDD